MVKIFLSFEGLYSAVDAIVLTDLLVFGGASGFEICFGKVRLGGWK
jgi:hypothetical protein